MSDIIQFIRSFSEAALYVDIHERVLSIQIDIQNENVYLCYYFENLNQDDDSEIEDKKIISGILSGEIEVTRFSMKYWIEYEEVNEIESKFPLIQSKSSEGLKFSLCKFYYQIFNKIPNYKIGYPDESYCSGSISIKYVEIIFFPDEHSKLITFYEHTKKSKSLFNFSIKPIVFSEGNTYSSGTNNEKSIPIVLTNTKTRRLGYLKKIIELFEGGNYYPISLLAISLEKLAPELQKELEEYQIFLGGNSKGLIKEGYRGVSAKPYIDLLKNFNLITEVNRSFILTKQVKPYFEINKSLKNIFQNLNTNIFVLQENDCLFFLEAIIRNDIIYTGAVVEIAKILGEEFKSKDIYPLLKDYLVNLLKCISNKLVQDRREQLLSVIIKRVIAWEKDKIYAEHIIEPRINWLLDLKLIKQSEKKGFYRFTNAGDRFLNVLAGINEVFVRGWLDNTLFSEDCFFSAFDYIYQSEAKTKWDEEIILEYLDQAMGIFKTDAPRRIAASQAINYTCSMYLLKNKYLANFNQVKDFLLNKKTNSFSLEWYRTENDGSLTK